MSTTIPTPIPVALLGTPRVIACPYHQCGCGAIYTYEAWAALPLVGYQTFDVGDGGPPCRLEHRDCPCGNTMTIDHG